MKKKANDPILDELVTIKQLLIVDLMRQGVTPSQIAAALGIHKSQMSRAFPKGFAKAFKVKK